MDFSRYEDDDDDNYAPSRRSRSRRGGCLKPLCLLILGLFFLVASGIALLPFWMVGEKGTPNPKFIAAVNSTIAPAKFSCKSLRAGWFSPMELRGVRVENPQSGADFTADKIVFSKSFLKLLPIKWFKLSLGTVVVESPKLLIDNKKRNASEVSSDYGRGNLLIPVVDAKFDLVVKKGEVEMVDAEGNRRFLRDIRGMISLTSVFESLKVSLAMTPENCEREAEIEIHASWKFGGVQIDELKVVSPWINATGSGRLAWSDTSMPDYSLRLYAKADATAIARDFRPLFSSIPKMIGEVELEVNTKQFITHAAVNVKAKLTDFAVSLEDGKSSAVDKAALKCDFSVPCLHTEYLPKLRDVVVDLELGEGRVNGKIESIGLDLPAARVKQGDFSVKCDTKVFTRAIGAWMDRRAIAAINKILPRVDAEVGVNSILAGMAFDVKLQPFNYGGLYAGESKLNMLVADKFVRCDFSANVNGGRVHLNPVFHSDGKIESDRRVRALEKIRLTQELVNMYLSPINPLFTKCHLDNGSLSLELHSFRMPDPDKPETIAMVADVLLHGVKMTPGEDFAKPMRLLKIKDSKLSFPDLSTRLKIAGEQVHIGETPFKMGGMNFALSGSSTFEGALDYTLKIEITEQLLKDNQLAFLAPLFKGKMLPMHIGGTAEQPQVEINALMRGLRDIFNIPLKID